MKKESAETLRNKHRVKGFYPGGEIKKEKGIKLVGNRHERRRKVRMSANELNRLNKRYGRFNEIKGMATQVRKWYDKTFKELGIWKWLENEMGKLLSVKGESNYTKPKAKRKSRNKWARQ